MNLGSKLTIIFALHFCIANIDAQAPLLEFNKEYNQLSLNSGKTLVYQLNFKKGGIYQFSLNQEGIAIYYSLQSPTGQVVYESNYPDDIYGLEKFEHAALDDGNFKLTIKRFDDPQNTDEGKISLFVKSLNKKEVRVRNKIKKELEEENKKIVTTIDIDHFWEAYDLLKEGKSKQDSIKIIQETYLDRATNGMLDFIQARELTAEKYIQTISRDKDFYNSIRENTYVTKKAAPIVEEVFKKFSGLYTKFQPFKVCFAIGINNTGGTVTNEYVLIGSEITTNIGKDAAEEEILENIRGIVAHECVHTQQNHSQNEVSIQCPLLFHSIREGAADFIAELVSGSSRSSEYGEKNEESLWMEFKNELCNQDIGSWLYNGLTAKDRPGDLGYYMGYEIVKSYYNHKSNKKQAIIDIIEMDNPIIFLDKSMYDLKF